MSSNVKLTRKRIEKMRESMSWAAIAEHYNLSASALHRFWASEADEHVVVRRKTSLGSRVEAANEALSGSIATANGSGLVPELSSFVRWMRSRGVASIAIRITEDTFEYSMTHTVTGKGDC